MDVTEQELQDLYTWVDEIPLSRPKRNIARDFSDGVLLAEVVAHYFPKLVELHNYSSANATTQKLYNWNTLNQKVFKRMGFTLTKQEFEAVANCQPGSVERVLKLLRMRIDKCKQEGLPGDACSVVPHASPSMVPNAAAVISTRPAMAPGHMGSISSKEASPYAATAMGPAGHMVVPAAALGPRLNPGSLGPSPSAGGPRGPAGKALAAVGGVPAEVLAEKEQVISELRETNEILETKVRKLEQLVRLKDAKISTLMAKLQSAGLT